MCLNTLGEFISENLNNVTEHYPDVGIMVFQVMPNHVHAIPFVDETNGINGNNETDLGCGDGNDAANGQITGNDWGYDDGRDAARIDSRDAVGSIVETRRTPSLRWEQTNRNEPTNEKMQLISQRKGRLSVAIGGIKSATTKYANHNHIPFGWQPRFYDRIIRDADEYDRIARYIENNPAKWEQDKLYKNKK
jgi:putative transposase